MYIVRNFPTFESTKEYVVDFNSRVTGVFAIARTVEGNYRVEIVNEGAVPANSERRYVMSWVEPTPPPSLETNADDKTSTFNYNIDSGMPDLSENPLGWA